MRSPNTFFNDPLLISAIKMQTIIIENLLRVKFDTVCGKGLKQCYQSYNNYVLEKNIRGGKVSCNFIFFGKWQSSDSVINV